MGSYPREIEVGNGPNVIADTQADYDAFMAAARNNAEIIRNEELAEGKRALMAVLFNKTRRTDR